MDESLWELRTTLKSKFVAYVVTDISTICLYVITTSGEACIFLIGNPDGKKSVV